MRTWYAFQSGEPGEPAARSLRILQLDHVAREVGREALERVVEEVAPLPPGDQLLDDLVAAGAELLAFAERKFPDRRRLHDVRAIEEVQALLQVSV